MKCDSVMTVRKECFPYGAVCSFFLASFDNHLHHIEAQGPAKEASLGKFVCWLSSTLLYHFPPASSNCDFIINTFEYEEENKGENQ